MGFNISRTGNALNAYTTLNVRSGNGIVSYPRQPRVSKKVAGSEIFDGLALAPEDANAESNDDPSGEPCSNDDEEDDD